MTATTCTAPQSSILQDASDSRDWDMALALGLMGTRSIEALATTAVSTEIGGWDEVASVSLIADRTSFEALPDAVTTMRAMLTIVFRDSSCMRVPVVFSTACVDGSAVQSIDVDTGGSTGTAADLHVIERATSTPGYGETFETVAAAAARRNADDAHARIRARWYSDEYVRIADGWTDASVPGGQAIAA